MRILFKNMCRVLGNVPVHLQNKGATAACRTHFHKTYNRSSFIALKNNFRKVHDSSETEEVEDIDPVTLHEDAPVFVRNALYPDSKDPIINNLINSTSIQDVLDIVRENKNRLNNQQVTQAVVALWDLIKVLHHLSGLPETRENVKSNSVAVQLRGTSDFQTLVKFVQQNINGFNAADLSYIHLYLSKLGMEENEDAMRLIVDKLKPKLAEEFSLPAASRFITTCFNEYSLRSLFNIQNLVPPVLQKIDNCTTAEEMKYLTVCLHHMHAFVTQEMSQKYRLKVEEMISNSALQPQDFKTILKVLMLLNKAECRDANIELIRKCSILIKRTISEMSAAEVYLMYEIFHKNQESAEILNEIKRSTTKHFLQMEEEANPNVHLRLKLLSALITLASPYQRPQYHRTIAKYTKENLQLEALFALRRILSDAKTSDRATCNRLWDQIRLHVVKSDDRNLLRLVSEYSNFTVDIANYRNTKFENVLRLLIDKELDRGIFNLLPSVLAHVSLFYLPYCNSRRKVERFVNRLCENWNQLNSTDWMKISKAVQTAREVTDNAALEKTDCLKIKKACDMYVLNNIGNLKLRSINLLLKSYVLREEVSNRLVDYLVIAASVNPEMSSNLLKNTLYCFRCTSSFSEDVMENICDYICRNYTHLMGTTVEKYLHFCYFANYSPKNSDKFFQVATDVLIRDKERMNGLTYLEAALALCFFNRLPNSFIKHIFNVAFLEKLDAELAACYSKATYPSRVRHVMMQLNRAVCLDYPEANVPWFHEKYVQERKAAERRSNNENVFHLQVYESLLAVTRNPDLIQRNVDVPYGYFVDFVIALNKSDEITDRFGGSISTQFAFILTTLKAYLRFDDQLLGEYELKRRHLEILGYKVVFISLRNWLSLVSNKNRVDYLKRIIWPDKVEKYAAATDR